VAAGCAAVAGGVSMRSSVSVRTAARALTWHRTVAGILPGTRSTSMPAVRVFHDQVPARLPSMRILNLAELGQRCDTRPRRYRATNAASSDSPSSPCCTGSPGHSRSRRRPWASHRPTASPTGSIRRAADAYARAFNEYSAAADADVYVTVSFVPSASKTG
jgi:hypothetical protein